MCFYQNALDANNYCDDTHKINHICMEVGISNKLARDRNREHELLYTLKTK
jgi:hypothetical protein